MVCVAGSIESGFPHRVAPVTFVCYYLLHVLVVPGCLKWHHVPPYQVPQIGVQEVVGPKEYLHYDVFLIPWGRAWDTP